MAKKHPSRSFHSLLDEPAYIPVMETTRGYAFYTGVTVLPGKDYSLDNPPISGNKEFIDSLRNYTIRKTYDARLEERLKYLGIEYKAEMCKSCGGRIKKLVYNPLVFVE